MSKLTANDAFLLEGCGKVIAQGGDDKIQLQQLVNVFYECQDEIVDKLALSVLAHSNHERTVRRANVDLFRQRVKGPNLYLVVCPASAPTNEEVQELTDDMELLSFGPYSNGFRFPAEPR